MITKVSWEFSSLQNSRTAFGSDLWPCAWARDNNLYCAWGDGGGFDGNDDQVGRVSLGFARLTGVPRGNGTRGFAGKNVWGAPPFAESQAYFGGKVQSMVSASGTLYASGAFWTADICSDPTHKSGAGPLYAMAWSSDLGKTWRITGWSAPSVLGSFLNAGKDNEAAPESFIYVYYLRAGDQRHLFLKRVAPDQVLADPAVPGVYTYFTGADTDGRASWTNTEAEAHPIFTDSNQVDYPDVVYDKPLHRYLMTAGHYRSGSYSDASVGQFGLFESLTPWGPWSTVAYYDDWGDYPARLSGDFLGMHMPQDWHSADGKTRWFVFSGLAELDAFNLIKATFRIHKSAR